MFRYCTEIRFGGQAGRMMWLLLVFGSKRDRQCIDAAESNDKRRRTIKTDQPRLHDLLRLNSHFETGRWILKSDIFLQTHNSLCPAFFFLCNTNVYTLGYSTNPKIRYRSKLRCMPRPVRLVGETQSSLHATTYIVPAST